MQKLKYAHPVKFQNIALAFHLKFNLRFSLSHDLLADWT